MKLEQRGNNKGKGGLVRGMKRDGGGGGEEMKKEKREDVRKRIRRK